MTYSCNKWSPSVPLHFCRNSEAWLGPIKIAFVMRCCDAGYDITLWSTTPRVSSYHKLTIKYFIFILNNIDGSIISYAMTANSMAIYWYWLIITLWVTYLVLKQDYSTPNPSPDLNLTPLAAFLRFLPSAARLAALGKKRKKAARGVRFKSGLTKPILAIAFDSWHGKPKANKPSN